jgi:hypothetical protein
LFATVIVLSVVGLIVVHGRYFGVMLALYSVLLVAAIVDHRRTRRSPGDR